ncbi:MAG: hypothetical protein MUC88_27575 [Planctomycetes bacterium]|nr:hypothetical protein [Planctomycetota bacterium]
MMRGEAGARAATGGQVDEFTRDLSRLAVDKAEKDAQLQTVRRQLEDVQKQLAQIAPATPRTDAEATNLGGQKNDLMRRTQVLELDLAGLAARHQALQEQITLIQGDAGLRAVAGGQLEEFTREQNRLVVDKAGREAQLQTVRKQLGDVQERLAQAAPTTPHTDAEAVNLGGQRNEVTRRAQVLELDLAGLDARRKALQEQIALIRGDADRRATAGAQLEEFTRERSRLAVDQAGKAAQLRTARRQLEEVQKQLARALASD